MKGTVFILLCLAFMGTAEAQNQLDDQGRKTGPWKVDYPNGRTLFEGSFEEGKPVGALIRYYDTGGIRASMYFYPGSELSTAILYFKNGEKAAEGKYLDQLKDSVWTYYSEIDATVRMRETYALGQLEGPVTKYYPSGVISEEIIWKNDRKEGSWHQFYEDGSLRLEAQYLNGRLHGSYKVYYENSCLLMKGSYADDLSIGTWEYYDDKGSLLYELEYKDGLPVNQNLYKELMQDTLLKTDSINSPPPGPAF